MTMMMPTAPWRWRYQAPLCLPPTRLALILVWAQPAAAWQGLTAWRATHWPQPHARQWRQQVSELLTTTTITSDRIINHSWACTTHTALVLMRMMMITMGSTMHR